MLRVVLDANVYVSAAIHPRGVPGQIIERFLRDLAFEIVVSPSIAREIARALGYPKLRRYFSKDFNPRAWLEQILLLSLVTRDEYQIRNVSKDPDDDKYIAAAVEGQADLLVSGDPDLLDLKQYEGIRVITPREFLNLLSGV
jgi:uncharacterized protein